MKQNIIIKLKSDVTIVKNDSYEYVLNEYVNILDVEILADVVHIMKKREIK